MIKKVKTKKKRNSSMNDEFMKWFIKARFEAMRYKLPHDYIFNGKLYQIKTTKEYLMQDYLQHLKDSYKENEILELMKLENYTDEELLEYAKIEKTKRLKEID